MELTMARLDTPLGAVVMAVAHGALCVLEFGEHEERVMTALTTRFGPGEPQMVDDPGGYASRLTAYLAGDLAALDDITVDTGGTPFQREVWTALRRIPLGATTSYGALAESISRPRAVRAVGAANGRNPVSIVIPCHRVIGADGTLTGYGGGLDRKRWLLEHEGALN